MIHFNLVFLAQWSVCGIVDTFAISLTVHRLLSITVCLRALPLPMIHPISAQIPTHHQRQFFFDPNWDDRDSVACILCGEELSDWDADDDPFKIHYSKCQNSCTWVVVQCGLTIDLDEDGRYGRSIVHSHLDCSPLPIASCSGIGSVFPRPKPWKRPDWKHSARIGSPMTTNLVTLQGMPSTSP